jgi:branched-chain amino acid transport system ATP-binding protein
MSGATLDLEGVRAGYRGGAVLDHLDLQVASGQVVALLGRNGVGKTTLLSTVMGLVRPDEGSIRIDGRELARATPDAVARAGVGFCPQGRRLFAPLSVQENLTIGLRNGSGRRWSLDRVYELFPQLAARRTHRGDQLSGGEQQMVAIARALLGNPRLLLLDEPSDGLAGSVILQLTDALGVLREEGMSVLLVEQNLRMAFALADDIAVMQKGRIVHRAATPEFRADPDTARALLGVG